MFQKQKKAFRAYCMERKYLYRMFILWFRRRTNRSMRSARREKGIDNNMVLFSSYKMESFNDNPYYICEALHKMRPETELVWLFRSIERARTKFDIPDYVRLVEWDTPEALEAMGRAKVLVDNWRKNDFLRFGRQQVYLFSPHHDRSFKHGLFSCKDPNRLYSHVIESHAHAATIGSGFNRKFLRKAYHFKGKFIEAGLPRNDILVRNDSADEARIRAKLGIDPETGVLLYAPTFRDADLEGAGAQKVGLDLEHVLDVLEETTGKRWVCLFRAHYFSPGLDIAGPSERRMDVTDYPEMAELLRIADALISDYSCCAGDFALRGKPVWLYIADIDDYAARSRKLYVDPLDTPYRCARTPEELDAFIRLTTPENARDNCRAVLDFYDTHETGRAAEAAAKYICEQLG